MPKYWGKLIFAHGRFPEVDQKIKMEKKREERLNDGNNNGQLRIATSPGVAVKRRKKLENFHTWEIPRSGSKGKDGEKKDDRMMVITMAKLRMAHASTHGARKPPGPIMLVW